MNGKERDLKMSIADNIKKIRSDYNLTQQQLGAIAGVSDKAVSKWEIGLAEPRMGAVQRIADALKIPKSKIIDEYDEYLSERDELLEKAFSDRPDLRLLFSAAKDASPEDIQTAIKIISALKDK